MIFVTVGTQLPFDRLGRQMDAWAARTGEAVFMQTGVTKEKFGSIQHKPFLSPEEFEEKFTQADLVVAHAGMGSILMALSHGKPLIVMPRRAELREHRNDHQMATARHFVKAGSVHVAFDEEDLAAMLSNRMALAASSKISPYAPDAFLGEIKRLILD